MCACIEEEHGWRKAGATMLLAQAGGFEHVLGPLRGAEDGMT